MTQHAVYTCDWPREDDMGTCSAQTRLEPDEAEGWIEIQRIDADVSISHLCPAHSQEVSGVFE